MKHFLCLSLDPVCEMGKGSQHPQEHQRSLGICSLAALQKLVHPPLTVPPFLPPLHLYTAAQINMTDHPHC